MKNLLKLFGLLLIVITLSFTATDKKTVIIDVAHGGHDDGNITEGVSEKDVVLSIANKIKKLSADENVEIILTRTADEAISLKDRTAYINSLNADLMISLHINAHRDNTKNGLEIFVSENNSKFAESSELAEKLRSIFSPDFTVPDVKKANFVVLKNTNCPSVLLEVGFLTNKDDRELITSEAGQDKIARSIYRALNQ